MKRIAFSVLTAVSIIAIIAHWRNRLPSPERMTRPPGYEWFTVQRNEYHSRPWLTNLHLVPAFVYAITVPFQFSTTMRAKHLNAHRMIGRFLLATMPIIALTGLIMGWVMPYGGLLETISASILFFLVLAATIKGFSAIRHHDIKNHRAWMIRLFAWCMSVATMRLILGIFYDLQPWSDRYWFGFSMAVALVVNSAFAEFVVKDN